MTYLDEYFDEYAEEFAAEPLPSEAIGLYGVSPEKQRRERRDIRATWLKLRRAVSS